MEGSRSKARHRLSRGWPGYSTLLSTVICRLIRQYDLCKWKASGWRAAAITQASTAAKSLRKYSSRRATQRFIWPKFNFRSNRVIFGWQIAFSNFVEYRNLKIDKNRTSDLHFVKIYQLIINKQDKHDLQSSSIFTSMIFFKLLIKRSPRFLSKFTLKSLFDTKGVAESTNLFESI